MSARHVVLVCGGREFCFRRVVYASLDGLIPRPTEIIHGGAWGADQLADDWAAFREVPRRTFLADWETHGKKAGPMRNQRMLDEGRPNLVIAFPGARGTADMVRRAKEARIPVIEVQ